jgi:transcriptional regulator with XRE-family HTH domain
VQGVADIEAVYPRFGARLRSERRMAGLTQEDLAVRLGLSRTTVVNIERGRQRIALHQLLQIADAVGCEVLHLLPEQTEGMTPDAIDDTEEFVNRVRAQSRRNR